MAHAEDQIKRYQNEIAALRRAEARVPDETPDYASHWAALSTGFMFGAGFPEASATIAHLYRKAYPGAPFPVLWEGEGD